MLVYHPAYDLYNCIFRMLTILSYAKDDSIAFDKLRIWDFYLTFPNLVRNISFPQDLRELKEKIFKDKVNPYDDVTDAKRIFEKMHPYQISACKCIAVYGFIDSKSLSNKKIVKTGKELPKEILSQIDKLSVSKKNVIKLLINDFVDLPMYGDKGLKARTGLIDFKYDPK